MVIVVNVYRSNVLQDERSKGVERVEMVSRILKGLMSLKNVI